MNKYKLYCTFHGWVEVISSSTPTKCPIVETDTIKSDSIVIEEEDVEVCFSDPTYKELTLEEYKQLRYNEIDCKSQELISNGFIYQSKTFSLSTTAQINILGLDEVRNDPALTYPIIYNTIDDLETYDIIDATNLHNMYLSALATKKGILDSGTNLKNSVRNCTTEAEVDAIIDNR
jgi:hypothetical protein